MIHALEPLVVDARRERLRAVIAQRLGGVTVVLDSPHDPHNGAAVLRSCDAFGVYRVHILPGQEPFQVAQRVTQGTERWVECIEHRSAAELTQHLGGEGFALVTTHPQGNLVPEDLAHLPRLALIMGNEHAGISDELAAAATESVRIEMRGFVESLNMSVSAALLLRAATQGRQSDLPDEERERLYALALFRSVPRASEVLGAMVVPM